MIVCGYDNANQADPSFVVERLGPFELGVCGARAEPQSRSRADGRFNRTCTSVDCADHGFVTGPGNSGYGDLIHPDCGDHVDLEVGDRVAVGSAEHSDYQPVPLFDCLHYGSYGAGIVPFGHCTLARG